MDASDAIVQIILLFIVIRLLIALSRVGTAIGCGCERAHHKEEEQGDELEPEEVEDELATLDLVAVG